MSTSEHMTLEQIEEFLKQHTDLKNYTIYELVRSIETLVNNSYEDGFISTDEDY